VRAKRSNVAHSLVFCAWLILLPIVNPQSLGHNGIILALPLVVLARTLRASGRDWHRWLWAASLILVSIPKQTVWRFSPPPVEPLAGLLVSSLPTWGALMLFGVSICLARDELASPASAKIVGLPTSSEAATLEEGRRVRSRRMHSHV
jgi:hypothetical protein